MSANLMERPAAGKKGNLEHRDTEEVLRFIHMNDNMVRRVAVLQLQHPKGQTRRAE